MFASDDMVISTGYLQVRLCQMRLAAQVSLMFLTFARYEESAAVRMGDMHRDGDNLIVMCPKGKTYQFSESRMADITGNATLMINPVQVIRVYMSRLEGVSGNKSRLLFPNLTSSSKGDLSLDKPASYDSVLNQFKSLVREAGLSTNPADFGLHLMRRGGVTAAVNGGAGLGCPYFPNVGNKKEATGGIMYQCQTNSNTKFQILSSTFEDFLPFFRL